MVHPGSDRISRVPSYSSTDSTGDRNFVYGAITRFGDPFQWSSTIPVIACPTLCRGWLVGLQPHRCNGCSLDTPMVWATPRSLAATEGISQLIPSPPGTEMFQFSGFAPDRLCIQRSVTDVPIRRVSPFGHPRVRACLAANRGFSQPSTSFFAGRRLGIHRTPLVA